MIKEYEKDAVKLRLLEAEMEKDRFYAMKLLEPNSSIKEVQLIEDRCYSINGIEIWMGMRKNFWMNNSYSNQMGLRAVILGTADFFLEEEDYFQNTSHIHRGSIVWLKNSNNIGAYYLRPGVSFSITMFKHTSIKRFDDLTDRLVDLMHTILNAYY